MNKKLVAVAIAGLLAAPLAQAQTANVTLYGRVNLSMEFVNAHSDVSRGGGNNTVYRVSSNSSRFGLRGTEALGGGLSAIFQIENSVNADAGGGYIAARETFVGLQGAWGTVKLGNFLSPYDDIAPIFGSVPTLLTGILASNALWAQANGVSNANGGFDNRNPNSLRYDSPVMAGFNGSIQYSAMGNSPTVYNTLGGAPVNPSTGVVEGIPTSNSGNLTLGGFYNNGPAQFGVAYSRNNDVRGAGLGDYAFSVAGAWNFGQVWGIAGWKVGAVWERLDYDYSTSSDLCRDFWSVSTTMNIGPGQLYASWGVAKDAGGSAPSGATIGQIVKGGDTGADIWTISYTFPLSKRTLVYGGYVKVNNESNAIYNFNNGAPGVRSGGNPGGLSLGTVHFF